MNARGERIIVFGDSLSHHGSDNAPEIWDVDEGSNRVTGQPGDLLASLLAEQGAEAVRVNARVGRSAHNFWGRENTAELLASDAAFAPTKVIIFLGTNDIGLNPEIDGQDMQRIKDAYEQMGAEVWGIGPVMYVDANLNAHAQEIVDMMASIFAGRFVDPRTLTQVAGRAGDGVHFGAESARNTGLALADAVLSSSPLKSWRGLAIGAAVIIGGALAYSWWSRKAPSLNGPELVEPELAGYRVVYGTSSGNKVGYVYDQNGVIESLAAAEKLRRSYSRQGMWAWIETDTGEFVPVKGAKKRPKGYLTPLDGLDESRARSAERAIADEFFGVPEAGKKVARSFLDQADAAVTDLEAETAQVDQAAKKLRKKAKAAHDKTAKARDRVMDDEILNEAYDDGDEDTIELFESLEQAVAPDGEAIADTNDDWNASVKTAKNAIDNAREGLGKTDIVDGKRWNGSTNELIRDGAREIPCKSGLVNQARCWTKQKQLVGPKEDADAITMVANDAAHEGDFKRALEVLKERPAPKILTSYEIVTSESAEDSDAAERGWEDQDGYEIEIDEDDLQEATKAGSDNPVASAYAAKTAEFLKREYANEESSSSFHPGIWYSTTDENPYTGESKTRSFHLKNFTKTEEEFVFNRGHR